MEDKNPAMLVKKLITLAGALGILACGACFLPDVVDRQPPPPLIPALQGVKTIVVLATNSSSTHHIDADRLAAAIVKDINQRHGTKIRAVAGTTAGPADATLSVDIRDELATSSPVDKSGRLLWTFEPKVSATLARADGQLLWEEKEQVYEVKPWITTSDEAEAWKEFCRRAWALPEILGPDFPDVMLYGRR